MLSYTHDFFFYLNLTHEPILISSYDLTSYNHMNAESTFNNHLGGVEVEIALLFLTKEQLVSFQHKDGCMDALHHEVSEMKFSTNT